MSVRKVIWLAHVVAKVSPSRAPSLSPPQSTEYKDLVVAQISVKETRTSEVSRHDCVVLFYTWHGSSDPHVCSAYQGK